MKDVKMGDGKNAGYVVVIVCEADFVKLGHGTCPTPR
jgi:hypothetical protein